MQNFTVLNEKLDLLLKKYTSLKQEKEHLQATIVKQNKLIEELNNKLIKLEDDVASSKTNAVIANDKDKKAVKKQIDTLITDIDKIMATLDD
ncbi:MAG: hypothetical protein R2800_04365 [Flavipsychrobacter sp.]